MGRLPVFLSVLTGTRRGAGERKAAPEVLWLVGVIGIVIMLVVVMVTQSLTTPHFVI
jgi:Na+-driven multidrug efflux pump